MCTHTNNDTDKRCYNSRRADAAIRRKQMPNFLNLSCPNCKSDKVEVNATVWVRLCFDGTERQGDTEWGDNDRARCADCNWIGTVKDLLED